jgi:bacterioferritin-associated ferredoxin
MKQNIRVGVTVRSALILAGVFAGNSLMAQTPPAGGYTSAGSVSGITYTVLGLTRNANGTLTESIRLQAKEGETVKPEAIGFTPYYPDSEYPSLDFHLVDFAHKQRYSKLEDSGGRCMCTKLTDQQISELAAGKPQVINIKYAAPPADVTSLSVELPHAEAIDDMPVTQAAAPTAAATATPTGHFTSVGSVAGVRYTVLGLKRNGNGTLTESIQLEAIAGESVKPQAIGFTPYYPDAEYPSLEYHLVDFSHQKRYSKVEDTGGNCMCTKLTDQQIAELAAGKPQVINIKFEAPPADVTNLTVELPHAESIDGVPVTG